MNKQKVLIGGGSGLVGTLLANRLKDQGYDVSILSRQKRKSDRFNYYQWDLNSMTIDTEAFNADHIINLTGAGIADKRWTKKRKAEIIDSRVNSTRLLLSGLKTNKSSVKSFISASAIGIYGDRSDEQLSEESAIGKNGFMVECCEKWEHEAHKISEHVDQFSILRIGIVLSSEGGALPKFILPMKLAQANYFGKGDQYYSWIHIEDLVRIISFTLQGSVTGTINAVSPKPLTNKLFVSESKKSIAPYAITYPIPSFVMKLFLGEMAAVILNSNRVIPQKLITANFNFKFIDLKTAVDDLLARKI